MAVKNDGIHKGHRQRMKRKFLEHSARAFDTYELLEMLLYNVIPYKDTNPVSKNLLSAFGSLDGVFNASREELMTVEGIGKGVADFILSLSDFAGLLYDGDTGSEKQSMSNFADAGSYFANFLSGSDDDQVAMMLLDSRMNLIDVKVLYHKKYASAGVRPEMFINYAIEKRATVALTAHNCRDATLFPSLGDIATTKMLGAALSNAGVQHLEHYLTAGKNFIGTVSENKYRLGQTPEIQEFLKSKEDFDAQR